MNIQFLAIQIDYYQEIRYKFKKRDFVDLSSLLVMNPKIVNTFSPLHNHIIVICKIRGQIYKKSQGEKDCLLIFFSSFFKFCSYICILLCIKFILEQNFKKLKQISKRQSFKESSQLRILLRIFINQAPDFYVNTKE